MRRRLSARLLLLDEEGHLLLFRYAVARGFLDGPSYWSTPGGGLEPGETFEDAAKRELLEETGILVETVGSPVAEREFILKLITEEEVVAEERYFSVRVPCQTISYAKWTALEMECMIEHRWWPLDELASTNDTVYPENLLDMLNDVNSTG
jgi:8-oxo-dGTP pyrophosphatase MutT (NUDIX family)